MEHICGARCDTMWQVEENLFLRLWTDIVLSDTLTSIVPIVSLYRAAQQQESVENFILDLTLAKP